MALEPINQPQRRRSLAWKLGLLGGGLVLVIFYFVVSSDAFFRAVIIPQAEQALQADIVAEEVSFHPFRSVVLRDLTVQTTDVSEPLLSAELLRVRYGLWDLVMGRWELEEVFLSQPVMGKCSRPRAITAN